jgi:hypothetical protein
MESTLSGDRQSISIVTELAERRRNLQGTDLFDLDEPFVHEETGETIKPQR